MKPAKPFLFGFWILVVIIIIRFLLVIATYFMLQSINENGYIVSRTTSWYTFSTVILIIIEATVYWYRRYKIPNKAWVYVHVGAVSLAMILIPIAMALLLPAYDRMYKPHEYERMLHTALAIEGYVYWGLLAIGHLFFILTIVRSFQLKESEINDTSRKPDEFVNRP